MHAVKARLGLGGGLPRDALRLILALSVTSLSSGYLGVVRPIYLSLLGFSPVQIGLLWTVASISGALRAALYGVLADRYGRKPILLLVYLSTIPFFLVYLVSTDYALFIVASIIAGTGAVGYGGVVQQALLTEQVGDRGRNAAFSLQFFASSALSTLGTLLSGLPDLLQTAYGVELVAAVRVLFTLGIALTLVSTVIVLPVRERLTRAQPVEGERRPRPRRSWRVIGKFAIYFIFTGLGAGVIMPLFSLWFHLRFGIDMQTVGYIFAASKAVETFTYLLGPIIAPKFGLVNTIVTTRLGGAVCAALIPFAPVPVLAAVLYTARNAIQHISIPLRQSYMMAALRPEERASGAGIVHLSSAVSRSIAPTLGGYMMQELSTSLPLFVSAAVFTLSNVLYYLFFHKAKPPEERR
jgi:MFS family permease